METFQILSDQFSHFQHLFHRWLAIFCIISSYIFDLSSSPPTWGIPAPPRSSAASPTVHPHIRGAYGGMYPSGDYTLRFIPTYVGHTWWSPCLHGCRSVHPHIRGAYVVSPLKLTPRAGSSPHTWGILYWVGREKRYNRFIPTYVRHTLPFTA